MHALAALRSERSLGRGNGAGTRGSSSSAMRSARANALNTVSHWWCAFSPRRLSMCSVTKAWLAKPWKNSCASWLSKAPIMPALERHVHDQAGPPGKIDHHARQRLVQRHVGVAVAADALLVADRLQHRLAERDADVFDRVVAVDVQVALGLDVQVDQAMAGDLVEHVVEKADAGRELRLAAAVQVRRGRVICVSVVSRGTSARRVAVRRRDCACRAAEHACAFSSACRR